MIVKVCFRVETDFSDMPNFSRFFKREVVPTIEEACVGDVLNLKLVREV